MEVARRVGINLKTYSDGTWKTLYNAALEKEVDVIATLVKRPKREKIFEFTQPYISLAQYVITNKSLKEIQYLSEFLRDISSPILYRAHR